MPLRLQLSNVFMLIFFYRNSLLFRAMMPAKTPVTSEKTYDIQNGTISP